MGRQSSRVINITPQGEQDIYRITFQDGSSAECTNDHLWEVRDPNGRASVVPLSKIASYPFDRLRRTSIRTAAVYYQKRELPIDPYVLGALIGDGTLLFESICFSSVDTEIVQRIEARLGEEYEVRKRASGCDYTIGINRPYQSISKSRRMISNLKREGLWGCHSDEKFIPEDYKRSSVSHRRELLRGIFDTDGWVNSRGQPVLEQTSRQLAEDVRDVAESLGWLSTPIRTKSGSYVDKHGHRRICKTVYRQTLRLPDAKDVFTLSRKREKASSRKKPVQRTFRSIEKVRRDQAQCIQIADPRGLYITDRYVVTHNSGKTLGCLVWFFEQAIKGEPGGNYWWVAPVYSQAKIAYRRMKRMVPHGLAKSNESELTITLPNDVTLWFKGSDNPDTLYGEDVWAAVIDEASRCREESWFAVRSTLTATKGPIRIIGNVKGRKNWAFRLARIAESGAKDMHYSKITAYDAVEGKVLEKEEIEDAERAFRGRPEAFRELYLAEASDDAGNPFGYQHIAQCVAPLSNQPPMVWGWDLAKSQDWTVGIAIDQFGYVCRFERWQRPWEDTIDQITGLGDPVLETIQKRARDSGLGTPFHGFKFSAISKQQIMEGLVVAIQQEQLHFPEGPISQELETFEYEYTRTGVRYTAPEGLHDDCVVALALAQQQRAISIAPLVFTLGDEKSSPTKSEAEARDRAKKAMAKQVVLDSISSQGAYFPADRPIENDFEAGSE
jgi:hypothetical protein